MKILQLIPQFILPATDGGKIGILNIIKEFSKNSELELIVFAKEMPEIKYLKELETYGKINLIIKDISNSNKNILISIIKNQPVYLSKFYDNYVLEEIDNIIKNINFDVIHADHTSMAQIADYISNKTHKPWGFRLHNIESMIWYRYSLDLNFFDLKKYLIFYQSILLKKRESQLIEKANICFPITKNDKVYALKLAPYSKHLVSSAGVDLVNHKRLEIKRNPFQLAIATNYNWVHNVNGLIWFIEEVFPIVKKKIPELALKLFGKNIPENLKKYQGIDVIPVGFVEDLKKELSETSIYIAPLFVGSGIRIKILEAMAYELPIVSTSISAEGIEANEEDGLFISNEAEKQAKQILNLLRNPVNIDKLGKKARLLIKKKYSWERNVKVMLDEYEKINKIFKEKKILVDKIR